MEERISAVYCINNHEIWRGTDREAISAELATKRLRCGSCTDGDIANDFFYWRGNISCVNYESRPWGKFHVLDEGPGFKVKRLEVLPGQRLSLQSHEHREERWTTVAGTGELTIGDDVIVSQPSMSHTILKGQKHRISNTGTELLIIIEVQLGPEISEEDCIRYEDDYGRQGK